MLPSYSVTIKGVDCFGKWDLEADEGEEGGCFVSCYDTVTNEPFEYFYNGGGCTSWTHVVENLIEWGDRVGITIDELLSNSPNN